MLCNAQKTGGQRSVMSSPFMCFSVVEKNSRLPGVELDVGQCITRVTEYVHEG